MSRDFISSGIQNILEFGIDLRLESTEEETYYASQMCDYFNENSDFKAYLSGDRSFEIEIDRTSPIMEVSIKDSMLNILPYTEDILEAFTLLLAFIAKKHQQLITDFRGLDMHKIQSPEDVNSTIEDDDSDDDDFEWI